MNRLMKVIRDRDAISRQEFQHRTQVGTVIRSTSSISFYLYNCAKMRQAEQSNFSEEEYNALTAGGIRLNYLLAMNLGNEHSVVRYNNRVTHLVPVGNSLKVHYGPCRVPGAIQIESGLEFNVSGKENDHVPIVEVDKWEDIVVFLVRENGGLFENEVQFAASVMRLSSEVAISDDHLCACFDVSKAHLFPRFVAGTGGNRRPSVPNPTEDDLYGTIEALGSASVHHHYHAPVNHSNNNNNYSGGGAINHSGGGAINHSGGGAINHSGGAINHSGGGAINLGGDHMRADGNHNNGGGTFNIHGPPDAAAPPVAAQPQPPVPVAGQGPPPQPPSPVAGQGPPPQPPVPVPGQGPPPQPPVPVPGQGPPPQNPVPVPGQGPPPQPPVLVGGQGPPPRPQPFADNAVDIILRDGAGNATVVKMHNHPNVQYVKTQLYSWLQVPQKQNAGRTVCEACKSDMLATSRPGIACTTRAHRGNVASQLTALGL